MIPETADRIIRWLLAGPFLTLVLGLLCMIGLMLIGILAHCQVVYTPVNVTLTENDSYQVDLNHDGIVDATIQSKVFRVWCQRGDNKLWTLEAIGGQVVADVYAAALHLGDPINSRRHFEDDDVLITGLTWGPCGGEDFGSTWFRPNRFLGVRFSVNGEMHYGWIELADAGYFDQDGNLHAGTHISGFAYETIPNHSILAGQR